MDIVIQKNLSYNPELEKKGKIRYILRFKTWSFKSLNWIHTIFYKNGVKQIPEYNYLQIFLNNNALAVWIIDDGTRSGSGLSIATNSFKYEDLLKIQKYFKRSYDFKVSINKSGKENQFVLYFHSKSMPMLANYIKPFFVENIKHKLGKYGSSNLMKIYHSSLKLKLQLT